MFKHNYAKLCKSTSGDNSALNKSHKQSSYDKLFLWRRSHSYLLCPKEEPQYFKICCSWTLSLPWCHLKMNEQNAKFEILTPFFVLVLASGRISVKAHSTNSRFVWHRTRKRTVCRHVCVLFQPRNFMGWGSEGVKIQYTLFFQNLRATVLCLDLLYCVWRATVLCFGLHCILLRSTLFLCCYCCGGYEEVVQWKYWNPRWKSTLMKG